VSLILSLCFDSLADVDTPEPDEKSLITYISSLYDVFPDPPAIHPLYDPVSTMESTGNHLFVIVTIVELLLFLLLLIGGAVVDGHHGTMMDVILFLLSSY